MRRLLSHTSAAFVEEIEKHRDVMARGVHIQGLCYRKPLAVWMDVETDADDAGSKMRVWQNAWLVSPK